MLRPLLTGGSEFVAYLDALGAVDGQHCLIDWEDDNQSLFRAARGIAFARPAAHLLFLDQWNSGSSICRFCPEACSGNSIFESIHLERAATRVRGPCGDNGWPDRSGSVCSHSGIRFPQNGCLSCPHLGLCLNNQTSVNTNLVRKAGASDLDWLDELVDQRTDCRGTRIKSSAGSLRLGQDRRDLELG